MQNVPKIVRQRLQAATPAVNHPDADLLTAFAEHSLPEVERTVVLEHLARCGDCRDIVALALPAMEPVETATSPSASRWLTWPALRWGFVAAGVVAIASIGLLQYQRRSLPATVALKQSAHVEVAANEPKKQSLDQFVAAAPTEKREKLQSPSAPAFTDSAQVANGAVDAKKSVARADAPPALVLPPQAGGGKGSGGSAGAAGPLPHGPRVAANQWQQQNTVLNQAPMPVPPSAYSKQPQGHGDLSAKVAAPAATQTVEVSSAAPALATEDASLDAHQGQSQPTAQPSSGENSAYAVGKAKPPMPSASRAGVATNNQTSQDQAVRRLRGQPAPGQIGGYVVDPTGAVVSNARITITHSKTAGTATAVTNSQGAWLIAGLPTGNYKAQAEAPGFKTSVLDLNYDANQPSMYSFTLSPGSVSETVEVSAENAQVQTEGTVVGGLIADRQLSEIPINGRNVTELSTLSPGLLPRWTITSTGGLQRSFDQGKTWQTVDVNANHASFGGAASLEVAAKTSRAKVKDKEVDKARKQDAATLTFRAVAATGLDVWAGGSAGALYHSLDAGNHWTRIIPTSTGAILTGDIISLQFPDPQHGTLSTSTSEVWTTSDDGQTWQKQ
jgi:Carboxypeptidase regulatory-like domain/Photosynthesis system II assembly factor YCF48/Putative zinc-finger